MRRAGLVALACLVASVTLSMQVRESALVSADARRIHDRAIVIDAHVDTTQRLVFERTFDVGRRYDTGSVDLPRLREGGMDAAFFSIWMPGTITGPAAVARAMEQIEHVHEMVRRYPRDLALATSAADIRRAASENRIAVLLGMEGGHLIDGSLDHLRRAASLGVRYLTLTHSRNTPWADSSGDTPAHNGLTPFGWDVVRELNRLGVMVDVSHVSDRTFFDTLATTRAPIIASHSSCRAISNSPRNLTDEMLRAVAKNGGVVMINFHADFLSEEYRTATRSPELRAQLAEASRRCGNDEACSIAASGRINQAAMRSGALPAVTWEKVVEHIEHAVRVAGIDHVGLGSDFDGAVMPLGLEDATGLPTITAELLRRGYSEQDVTRILGGNLLRVMEAVEAAGGR